MKTSKIYIYGYTDVGSGQCFEYQAVCVALCVVSVDSCMYILCTFCESMNIFIPTFIPTQTKGMGVYC